MCTVLVLTRPDYVAGTHPDFVYSQLLVSRELDELTGVDEHGRRGRFRAHLALMVRGACLLGHNRGPSVLCTAQGTMPQVARRHLIMSIWLPLVVWVPVYIAIAGAAIAADQSMVGRAPF